MSQTKNPVRHESQATDLSLDKTLLEEAREYGIDISREAEAGIAAAVCSARRERWLAENRSAILAWNDWVEENGLPLAKYRQF